MSLNAIFSPRNSPFSPATLAVLGPIKTLLISRSIVQEGLTFSSILSL